MWDFKPCLELGPKVMVDQIGLGDSEGRVNFTIDTLLPDVSRMSREAFFPEGNAEGLRIVEYYFWSISRIKHEIYFHVLPRRLS